MLTDITPGLFPRLGISWQMKKLPRRIFGLVLQCRTGHGFMGEYYARHVPDENVSCPCGAVLQTRSHILQSCPRYEDFRHILQGVSRDIDMPVILGTKKGIKALSQFITKSGAFTKGGNVELENPDVDNCHFLDCFSCFLSLSLDCR